MTPFRIDVISVLVAFLSASVVVSKDIYMKVIKEAAEDACLLPVHSIMVQRPNTTTCLKSFFCEAEKALKHVFSKSTSVMRQRSNNTTCPKSSFCKNDKALKNTTGDELKILGRNLNQYNHKNGVGTCDLKKNTKYPLCKLLEDIAKCALLQVK